MFAEKQCLGFELLKKSSTRGFPSQAIRWVCRRPCSPGCDWEVPLLVQASSAGGDGPASLPSCEVQGMFVKAPAGSPFGVESFPRPPHPRVPSPARGHRPLRPLHLQFVLCSSLTSPIRASSSYLNFQSLRETPSGSASISSDEVPACPPRPPWLLPPLPQPPSCHLPHPPKVCCLPSTRCLFGP